MNEERRPLRRPFPNFHLAPRIPHRVERIGGSRGFGDEVLRLAELAPEPWRSELYRTAQGSRRAA
jgi:hypothetical protein